jgi:hypothetical protein
MAEFSPTIIPLGSLADAAAASAELSQQEAQAYAISPLDPGTTIGIIAEPTPDWP